MIKFLFVAVSLAVSTLSVKADGNKLLSTCSSSNHIDWGYCIGFISGAVSVTEDICKPTNVTQGQTRDIVVKFLQNNPGLRHYHEADIATAAVRAIFPCVKKVGS